MKLRAKFHARNKKTSAKRNWTVSTKKINFYTDNQDKTVANEPKIFDDLDSPELDEAVGENAAELLREEREET